MRPQAARGLGHDAGGDRQLPGRRRRDGRAGRDPHRHAQRIGLRRDDRRGLQGPHDPHLPHRRRGRRPRARHHQGVRRCPTCCRRPPIRRGPYTVNTIDEHLDMLMVCHHLDPAIAEDVAFAEIAHPPRDHRRRGHPARPRRVHHDVVGLAGDGPRRRGDHPHLADGAQDEGAARQRLPDDAGDNDNFAREALRRQVHDQPGDRPRHRARVGSVEVGKLADLVLWKPAFFGVKPALVLKGGMIAAARDGRPERLDPDAAAGALPADVRRLRRRAARPRSPSSRRRRCDAGELASAGTRASRSRRSQDTRGIGKKDMVHNDATPKIEVDPETYEVRADGELLDLRAGDGAADGAALLPLLMRHDPHRACR